MASMNVNFALTFLNTDELYAPQMIPRGFQRLHLQSHVKVCRLEAEVERMRLPTADV